VKLPDLHGLVLVLNEEKIESREAVAF